MKTLILSLLLLSSCKADIYCTKIAELGLCTEGSLLINSMCVVKMEDERILNVRAPTMVGRLVCVDKNSLEKYWYYPR